MTECDACAVPPLPPLGGRAVITAGALARLAGTCTLRRYVNRIQGLAGGHEQAIALRPTEANVSADLGEANASDELSLWVPYGHAAVTNVAARIARAPQVSLDVATSTVRSAFDPVDHKVGE